jgi:phosphoglycolate phosphatase-like HAD superfamily hydrolase
MELNEYEPNECLLVGDSVNDKEAAEFAKIKFKFFSHA